jgi:hypothetical protein
VFAHRLRAASAPQIFQIE